MEDGGLFAGIDHQERISLPQVDRQTGLDSEVVQELYNRYMFLLDELNAYRGRILYFLNFEGDVKDKEH